MSNHFAVSNTPIRWKAFHLSAVLLAFVPVQLWAEETGNGVKYNAVSAPQEAVSWMSGGIGDDARDEMRKAKAGYNVHLLFIDRHGNYLADIPFSVAWRDGRKIHSGISEGPLLYLKLPPGAYQIAAEIDGAWQTRRVQAVASGPAARMSFVARGE